MKTKHILLTLFALAGLAGCDDFLNVLPDNRTELDSAEKIQKLLTSAYSNRSHVLICEAASDNCDDMGANRGYDSPQYIEQMNRWEDMNIGETDSNVNTWQLYYNAINHANTALEAIEALGTPDELLPVKGEALMCRAYCHFCLTMLYCLPYHPEKSVEYLGVPYMESPAKKINATYERGNLKTVYEKIDRDIEEALPLIRDDVYSVPKYHFNRSASYAFAARFNLYYLKWDKVVEYADLVLGSNPALVLRDWDAVGSLQWDSSTRPRDYNNPAHSCNLLNISLIGMTPWFLHPWQSYGGRFAHCNRVTKTETFRAKRPMGGPFDSGNTDSGSKIYRHAPWTYNANTNNKSYQPKWSIEWMGTGYASVYVAFTTNETLLCRAEGYIHLKEYDKAVADMEAWSRSFYKVGQNGIVSLTRARIAEVYGDPLSVNYIEEYTSAKPTSRKRLNPHGFTVEAGEQEHMLQCLLYCRRIETLADGLRWGDVKRYGIEIDRFENSEYRDENTSGFKVVDSMDKNDLRRALQIPEDVIIAGLEPNPRNENASSHPFRQ
ncbi:MAG: RagB/SusD family nutrient uptake outer membrane protein [Rikenellaceae bacterium]|jgi:hypothetical protein|nr:RagB/SusD family nutrient uptake outer membrane protein [Rikenellaceae bacterium]